MFSQPLFVFAPLLTRPRLERADVLPRCRKKVASWTMQHEHLVKDVKLLAVPMTQGGDVLFPGGNQLMSLNTEQAGRVLKAVTHCDPPEFAYLPVNAWGDPAPVGTIAVVDDLQLNASLDEARLLCTGVERFRILHLGESMESARVQIFHDDDPTEKELNDLPGLEQQLVETMTQIVRLSIKVSDASDEARQIALVETLKRVEAFRGNCEDREARTLLQHWILELSPQLRRELLSFVVIDLVSVSFMDRRNHIMSTNTADRLAEALRCLQPFVKELAAKGAIVTALGKNKSEG